MDHFVQSYSIPAAPSPKRRTPAREWLGRNLLTNPLQAAGTLIGLYLAFHLVWTIIDFTVLDAVWSGADRTACSAADVGLGACWPFVKEKFGQFMYGSRECLKHTRLSLG
ncbi:hypothetical protein [Rhizobium leguminosarum]|uniref:hypothetical protein n=1 Tax=Rhizobium leguminosarum TaxID=384 RepID=UPI001AEAA35E|nr:hypothetical protein [Rhizobium leguminosarum]MBP2449880.1 hypothetical protein [Rhizobium leguminosarum]